MFQFLLSFFLLFLGEEQNAKETQDLVFHPFRSQSDRRERKPGWLHLLVAQSFPGDAAEEGMTLDVTHTSTAGAQPVAGVKLEQLWSGILFTGRHCNIILCCACVVV